MPLSWRTDLFCPFSLLLCQLPVEGQLQEAGNEHFLRAQERALFISPLYISIRDCYFLGFWFCFVCFFFPPTFTFAQAGLGRGRKDKRSKACSHTDFVFSQVRQGSEICMPQLLWHHEGWLVHIWRGDTKCLFACSLCELYSGLGYPLNSNKAWKSSRIS